MAIQNRVPSLHSWIPSAITWVEEPGVFCVEVPTNDNDMVQFISCGQMDVTFPATKAIAQATAALIGKESLAAKLVKAVWSPGKLKSAVQRMKPGSTITAYCHGVFFLTDTNCLAVLVSFLKPEGSHNWISAKLKAEADALLVQHQNIIAKLKAEEVRWLDTVKKSLDSIESLESEQRQKYQAGIEFGAVMRSCNMPILTIETLLNQLPAATTFSQGSSNDLSTLQRSTVKAISASKSLPSRCGDYYGILFPTAGKQSKAIISWVPYAGLPSYTEVRWAVQRRLPAAMCKPRLQKIDRPTFDSTISSANDNSTHVGGFDPRTPVWTDALNDLQLDQKNFRDRAEQSRKIVKAFGFEAIAWFQPFHLWTEDTWGIYLDGQKLDDLACSFIEDLQQQGVRAPHSLAAQLAFGLVYEHELFHARVEAALSWQELNALQPRHLRYKERVYSVMRETSGWLEEALANWWAWSWFEQIKGQFSSIGKDDEALQRVVKASLDLSPPGYRDWRMGDDRETWRIFATQLSTANPNLSSPGLGLPLESVVKGPLPFDFSVADVPLHFVGHGQISDHLQSHPATFNVPSRREIEKALKHFNHNVDPSGGKGGHQKWTGPDKRAFILPTKDPLSIGVFKSFLHYVGIDKATYVRHVRPNL